MKLAPPALLAWLLLTMSLAAQTTVSYHTTLFGKLNPGSSGGRYSAIWGYTAPDGREYALLGGFDGLHIIDITESPIREVAFIDGPDNGWREIKTYSHYAYVVSEGGAGLQIVDLADLPASATLVREDTRFFTTGHTISQEGHFIYVNGSNPDAGANGGTIIFDVGANPTQPERVGTWTARYVHDAIIRNDTMWASAINDGRLDVVYLGADRRNPRFVADIVYPGAGTHNADLTTDGHYVMTTDEIGSTVKSLKVWDVSDIENIRKVADYTHNRGEIIHNVQTLGDLAVISWYTAGTRIVDISDPTDPVEVGFYDTFPGAMNTYAGNWGTYPYFASGKIVSSDMQTGLYVFTFDGARRGTVSGVVRDDETGEPIANATVTVPALGRSVTADALGRYRMTAANDTLAFTAVATDYLEGSGTFVLTTAGATVDIRLRPVVYANVQIEVVDETTLAPLAGYVWTALTPIAGGATSGAATLNPETFRVRVGATTQLSVGAWGFRPAAIELDGSETGVIKVSLHREYFDDAELDLGWSRVAPDDDAVNGRWQRGVPIGTSFASTFVQPGFDHTADPGRQAFITQITGTEQGIVGSSDVDSGRTSLTTPLMDLTALVEPVMTAWLWYSSDKFPDPASTNDTLRVFMSGDDGQSWQLIDRITGTGGDWRQFRYPVGQFMTPTTTMLFRVEASDLRQQSWVEAGLDDFRVIDAAGSGADAGVSAGVATVTVRPNPVTARASLDVTLAGGLDGARLELYDALGRMVTTLHTGAIAAGTASFPLDAEALTPGRYTWRLTAEAMTPMTGAIAVVR